MPSSSTASGKNSSGGVVAKSAASILPPTLVPVFKRLSLTKSSLAIFKNLSPAPSSCIKGFVHV